MLFRSKNAPTLSTGSTRSYDQFRRYDPVYEAVFSQYYCTQSSARAITRVSGDGGPHRKPDRGSALSFHPFFLLFLLFFSHSFTVLSLVRSSSFAPHSFAPAFFARLFTISTCSSMRLCFDFETVTRLLFYLGKKSATEQKNKTLPFNDLQAYGKQRKQKSVLAFILTEIIVRFVCFPPLHHRPTTALLRSTIRTVRLHSYNIINGRKIIVFSSC